MKKQTFLLCAVLPLLLVACGKKATVEQGDSGTGANAAFRYNFPTGGTVEDQRFGKETWFAYGALAGVENFPANGLAKSHCFEKEECIHTIQANISISKNGTFYEGWVLDPKTGERLSTGHLKSTLGDVRHNLSFETAKDIRAFTKVLITLEKDDGDPAPGKLVAQGTLKELKRDK